MLRTFIQVTALSLSFIACFFLVQGTLTISAKDIVEMSKAYWYSNQGLGKRMAQQKADTQVGFCLLLLSFMFQMINLLWPMRWVDFSVSVKGFIVAFFVSFFTIGILSWSLNKFLATKIQKDIADIAAQEHKNR